jgi:hypothetical protein
MRIYIDIEQRDTELQYIIGFWPTLLNLVNSSGKYSVIARNKHVLTICLNVY